MGHGSFDDAVEPYTELTLAEMRASCHLGSTRECTANTNKETTMVRRDGDIGLGAEARLALAFIEADAERRRVLKLPLMRVVCIVPDGLRWKAAVRPFTNSITYSDSLPVRTVHEVDGASAGNVAYVRASMVEAERGLRCDVVIALHGLDAERTAVATGWMSGPDSMAVWVLGPTPATMDTYESERDLAAELEAVKAEVLDLRAELNSLRADLTG